MPKLTKKAFEDHFREEVLPYVIERYGVSDRPARRQAWNDTVDSYIRDGMLSEAAGNWGHPRWLETWRPKRATSTDYAKKKKGQIGVLGGYRVDLDRGGQLVREKVDLTTPGDYGADPLGDGTFRMVPSGDIVDFAERTRRLEARRAGRSHATKKKSLARYWKVVRVDLINGEETPVAANFSTKADAEEAALDHLRASKSTRYLFKPKAQGSRPIKGPHDTY